MNPRKIVVHTDVLVDHLVHAGRGRSILRMAMENFFCYTTVFTAIELFSIARSEKERRNIEHVFSAMKILGLNARNAKKVGEWVSRQPPLPRFHLLIGGICLEARLPLLVMDPSTFRGIKELNVIPARRMQKEVDSRKISGATAYVTRKS